MSCCKKLISYKDFTSFSKVHTDVKNFNCNILKLFGNKMDIKLFLQLRLIDF